MSRFYVCFVALYIYFLIFGYYFIVLAEITTMNRMSHGSIYETYVHLMDISTEDTGSVAPPPPFIMLGIAAIIIQHTSSFTLQLKHNHNI